MLQFRLTKVAEAKSVLMCVYNFLYRIICLNLSRNICCSDTTCMEIFKFFKVLPKIISFHLK